MKKSLTRKLTIAVIALVFAVVSLSTSTYAWFTMSNKAQIDAFEAQVKAGEGIEIAVTSTELPGDAQWYTGNVPASVIKTVLAENQFNKFNALTTADAETFYAINYDSSVANVAQTDKKSYVSFYVHIKTAVAGTIKLSGIKFDSFDSLTTETNTPSAPDAWEADAKYKLNANNTIEIGTEVLYEVENSARLSVNQLVKSGNESSLNGALIYEKAAKEISGDAENGFDAGNTTGTTSQVGAFNYYNEKNKTQLTIPATEKYNTVKIAEDYSLIDDTSAGYTTTTVDEIITLQVNVWIEGWDAECLNAIFSQVLSTEIYFEFTETVQG